MPISSPSETDRREIAQTVNLAEDAAAFLSQTMDQIVAEIIDHAATKERIFSGRTRSAQIAYVRRLSKLLTKLETTLADSDLNTDRILRNTLGHVLGLLLSHTGIQQLLREQISGHIPRNLRMPIRGGTRSDAGYYDLERAMLGPRLDTANRTAPRLLLTLMRELNTPLLRSLDIERSNKRGSPGKPYRNHVIHRPAPVYRQIWGAEPVTTPSSKFVTLCELVLKVIGLDT